MNRRQFLQQSALAGGLLATSPLSFARGSGSVPSYLKDYAALYASDPRKAALKYFAEAKFGLFIHYGLYSLTEGVWNGQHSHPSEWIQLRSKIRVDEYAKLADRFTAEKFDADFITDLVLEAGMKYINLTTRHHDGFCLFDSKFSDFKSTNNPAKRDLVGELSEQCQKKGLGFYLYYSHGRDWKHPHAPNNEIWKKGNARPKYDPPEPSYAYGNDHDLQIYIEFMKNQVTELLTNYGPIGGIWLDGISVPMKRQDLLDQWKVQELYDHIHAMQPQVLVSYKQGLLGTEDFKAPERKYKGAVDVPLELCDTLQPHSWGYAKKDDGKHRDADDVMKMLAKAESMNANLLLNTGPLPDGSIYPDDITTLREVGKRRRQGA